MVEGFFQPLHNYYTIIIPQGLKGDQITLYNFSNQRLFTDWGWERKPVERDMKEKYNTRFKRKISSVLLQKREEKSLEKVAKCSLINIKPHISVLVRFLIRKSATNKRRSN